MNFAPSPLPETEPPLDCPLCPRLVAFREELRAEHPDWWNAPVPAFGDPNAWLCIVGLAPGKHGANRTGRPFTGDHAGDLLFCRRSPSSASRAARTMRGPMTDWRSTARSSAIRSNACRPQNKPTPAEIHTCRPFLQRQVDALPNARIFIALGQIAHQSAVKVLGGRLPKCRFGHLAEHRMPDGRMLIDSYHCSRYNQNTGRLTAEMFEAVFARALELRAAIAG